MKKKPSLVVTGNTADMFVTFPVVQATAAASVQLILQAQVWPKGHVETVADGSKLWAERTVFTTTADGVLMQVTYKVTGCQSFSDEAKTVCEKHAKSLRKAVKTIVKAADKPGGSVAVAAPPSASAADPAPEDGGFDADFD